jgi:hypothetical protein
VSNAPHPATELIVRCRLAQRPQIPQLDTLIVAALAVSTRGAGPMANMHNSRTVHMSGLPAHSESVLPGQERNVRHAHRVAVE